MQAAHARTRTHTCDLLKPLVHRVWAVPLHLGQCQVSLTLRLVFSRLCLKEEKSYFIFTTGLSLCVLTASMFRKTDSTLQPEGTTDGRCDCTS